MLLTLGVAFKTDVSKNKIILYVVTTAAVMSYDITTGGNKLVMTAHNNHIFLLEFSIILYTYILPLV